MCLASWVARINNRSPPGQMSQVNQFNTLAPHDWERIFEGSAGPISYSSQAPSSNAIFSSDGHHPGSPAVHLPPGIHRGNPDDPLSHAYKGSLL